MVMSPSWKWHGSLFSIFTLLCLFAWQIQVVRGQGGGAGAVDTPTTASAGGNPATPGSPDSPPPAVIPSGPSAGGLTLPDGSSPTASSGLALPTVMYVPPSPSGVDLNATEPYFPLKSVSCQQCRYFYPKLVECNLIAKQTLSLIPRLGEPGTNSSSITTSAPGARSISKSISQFQSKARDDRDGKWDGEEDMESMLVLMSKYVTSSNLGSATSTLSDPTGDAGSGPGAVASTPPSSSSPGGQDGNNPAVSSDRYDQGLGDEVSQPVIDFTTIMPFLQCICPNQGLAAAKVCLTCFRVSNQRNFLSELSHENVTTSLSAFAEACAVSHDGNQVPPPPAGTRGQSASVTPSSAGRHGSERAAVVLAGAIMLPAILLLWDSCSII
jgi:hypothetical protein